MPALPAHLEALFAGAVLALALFALLACAPERPRDRYLPEQFALLFGGGQ